MKKGFVFTFFRCVNPEICSWTVKNAEEKRDEEYRRKIVKGINDPCSKYPDCESCIMALDYCGWCTVNVLYNATTPGTQCAGLNQSKIPGFICKGTFSTVDCPNPPNPKSKQPSKAPPTPLPSLRPASPQVKPPPTTQPDLWTCNPNTSMCVQNSTGSGGMPLQECNLTCNVIPDVPVILRGRKFRGLQIQKGYIVGEWVAKFSTQTVSFAGPKGDSFTAVVSQTGQFMVLNLQSNQKVFTLWQLAPGAVVDFLSWSWGAVGGAPPASFDSAMTTDGQTAYVFDACSPLAGSSCFFGN